MTEPLRIGMIVTLTGTFRDTDGDLADPSTASLQIRYPDGTVGDELEIADFDHPSTGVYTFDLALTMADRHYWRWEGDGDVTSADEGSFYVSRSPVLEAAS